MNRRETGRNGELIAAAYLKNSGYRIVGMNFHARVGEIDIIAENGGNLSFVEVKNWRKYDYSNIEYVFNNRKKSKMILTSRYFLLKNPEFEEHSVSYDVIFIKNGNEKIKHLKNIFMETDGL